LKCGELCVIGSTDCVQLGLLESLLLQMSSAGWGRGSTRGAHETCWWSSGRKRDRLGWRSVAVTNYVWLLCTVLLCTGRCVWHGSCFPDACLNVCCVLLLVTPCHL